MSKDGLAAASSGELRPGAVLPVAVQHRVDSGTPPDAGSQQHPLQELVGLGVAGVGEGLEDVLVRPGVPAVLGRAGSLAGQADGVAGTGRGGSLSTIRWCFQPSPESYS